MVITVIAPKAQFFTSKSLDVQRDYLSLFKKYINLLVDNDVTIEYYLEDELVHNLLKDIPNAKTIVISAIPPSDMMFSMSNKDILSFPEYVYGYDSSVVKDATYGVEKKYVANPNLLKEGRDVYLNKRVEIARTRIRFAMDKKVREAKNILQFRANSTMDKCSPVHDTVILGDGRLCIEVSVTSGLCVVYYGGSYVPEDMLKEILKIQG